MDAASGRPDELHLLARQMAPMKRAWRHRLWVTALAGSWLACSGAIEPAAGPGNGPAPAADASGPGQLRRLTAAQFRRSLQDLLGAAPVGGLAEIEEPPISTSLRAIGASISAVSPRGVEQFEAAIESVLSPVFADAQRRAGLLGCQPAAAWEERCARSFLEGFGLRAWRRPLSPEEVDRYLKLGAEETAEAGQFAAGAQAMASALLQSPNFLYRVEVDGGGFAMASRMSFLLWGTTPDSSLLAAARDGLLDHAEGIGKQAQRLLDSPRIADGLRDLVEDVMRLDGVDIMVKDPALFPQLTPSLRQALRDEIVALFADALKRDADLMELWQTDRTFVNAELGKLYGIQVAGTALVEARHPAGVPRSGLLTAAALLTPHDKAHQTSPTRRGAFIRNNYLCDHIPDPPPGVDTSPRPLPPGVVISRRQSLAQHNTDVACSPCHDLMDPLGLALENFDAMGRHRVADENGLAIDASGSIDGVAFAGPRELGALLGQSPQARDCMARWVYRYATGREEGPQDGPRVERLVQAFARNGQRLEPLLMSLLLGDAPAARR